MYFTSRYTEKNFEILVESKCELHSGPSAKVDLNSSHKYERFSICQDRLFLHPYLMLSLICRHTNKGLASAVVRTRFDAAGVTVSQSQVGCNPLNNVLCLVRPNSSHHFCIKSVFRWSPRPKSTRGLLRQRSSEGLPSPSAGDASHGGRR